MSEFRKEKLYEVLGEMIGDLALMPQEAWYKVVAVLCVPAGLFIVFMYYYPLLALMLFLTVIAVVIYTLNYIYQHGNWMVKAGMRTAWLMMKKQIREAIGI